MHQLMQEEHSEEILDALEAPQHYMFQHDCYLSLHAMSGRAQGKAIQLRALVQNKALIILVDSGSSHTFLNSTIASKLKVCTTPALPMNVKVANGALLPCCSEVENFEWWCQGQTFQVNAKVIDMVACETWCWAWIGLSSIDL
jgi:hypothetical protein